MSKVQVIKIPEDICNKIQMLQYELDAHKELLAHMINAGVDVNTDAFKEYNKQYEDIFTEYNRVKQELQTTRLEPNVDSKLLKWNLNFITTEVTCEIE